MNNLTLPSGIALTRASFQLSMETHFILAGQPVFGKLEPFSTSGGQQNNSAQKNSI